VGRVRIGIALFCALVAAGSITTTRPARASAIPRYALIYGDSLTYESRASVAQEFSKLGWPDAQHEYPGFALCDFQQWLPADLAAYHPSVVAVESAGNFTRPCMLDANGNALDPSSDAFFAKYRADMHAFFKTVTDTGASVSWIVAPPMLDPEWDARIVKLEAVAKEVAASYPGVSISTAPRNHLANSGHYTATKACLKTETVAQGCGLPGPGLIWIRTVVGPQTGIHLCPGGLGSTAGFPCLPTNGITYASGEYRWGSAVADTTVKPPKPILPTLNVSAKAAVEGRPILFTPKLKFPYSRDLTLCYDTGDGTATAAGGDYSPVPDGCFVIPAWTTSGPAIPVNTLVDHVAEPSETVRFNVWATDAQLLGGTRSISGTIKTNNT
jgi:hypothetical protein